MTNQQIMRDISSADLTAELRRRGLIVATWSVEDVLFHAENHDRAGTRLIDDAAQRVFERISNGDEFADRIDDCARDWFGEMWSGHAEDTIASLQVREREDA